MTESPHEFAREVAHEYLDARFELANHPPGLREAVETRLAAISDEVTDRVKSQIKHLEARDLDRPNVYYAHQEAIETSLQESAAGIRTAMAIEGHIVDAVSFERSATQMLASTAAWAIRSEAARVPRPPTRHPALSWTLPPVPWLNDSTFPWPPPAVAALNAQNELTLDGLPRCSEAPYENWVQLGLIERQHTYASKHPDQPERQYVVHTGIGAVNEDRAATTPPFIGSAPSIWTHKAVELASTLQQAQVRANLSTLASPLVAFVGFESTFGAPRSDAAPGLHPFLLAPHIALSILLELAPESPSNRLMLVDDAGPALVCRQWSSFPIHDGNYEPLEPAVIGADLLIRPDLYDTASEAIGQSRLRIGFSLRVSV
ncbi:hypothetical protein AB0301_05075 [Microbacterium profundi]|uniref:Uncharacterized protein n=1 Tax=Microbacterium profundi TaxID=450380 RepID=A0ABV3LF37_9MICO